MKVKICGIRRREDVEFNKQPDSQGSYLRKAGGGSVSVRPPCWQDYLTSR